VSDETQYVVHLRVTMSGPDVEWAEVASTLAGRARALGAFRVGRYVGGAPFLYLRMEAEMFFTTTLPWLIGTAAVLAALAGIFPPLRRAMLLRGPEDGSETPSRNIPTDERALARARWPWNV